MPTVMAEPAANADLLASRVERQLQQAAARIRMADVLFGGLMIVAVTLAYAAVAMVVDRTWSLPGWARQVGFAGWLGGVAFLGYRQIVSPVVRRLNPLYTARKVESVIPEAKNSLVNYVDLQSKDLPATVRAAVARDAANEVTDSDIQKAGDGARLAWLGVASGVLVVVLAVLFLIFSPAQFFSLLNRTFQPFQSMEIVTRTRITISQPANPEITITAGQPIVFQVLIDGRLPRPDDADRVRLLLRHNPADPVAEEIDFAPGSTNREFQLRVPDYLVQNGFWYRIAAGDSETPEYKVTVRPRPLLTGFQVNYEYPAYLRMKPESTSIPQLEAFRGTKVTLVAESNRLVQSGRIAFEGKLESVEASRQADSPHSLKFQWTLNESGIYRIHFTTTDGEPNLDPPSYTIKIIPDNAPQVTIVKPEADEITLPLNGLIALDAVATDDVGIESLVTRFRLMGPTPTPLMDRPYRNGQSFRREADGSYPQRVELKDSFPIPSLRAVGNQPLALKEGDVLEVWVEAKDNCTVPEANIGKSAIKRIRLVTPPPQKPEEKKQQEQQQQQRKDEEQKHDQTQQQKFEKEDRPPPQKSDKGQEPSDKGQETSDKGQGNKGQGEKQEGTKQEGTKQEGTKQEGTKQEGTKQEGTKQEGTKQEGTKQEGSKTESNSTTPENSEKIQKESDRIARELNEQNQSGGSSKDSPSETKPMPSGESKPQPGNQGGEASSQAKEAPKPSGTPPMGQEPKPGDDASQGDKRQPPGGSAGREKPVEKSEKPNDDGKPETGTPMGSGEQKPPAGESKPQHAPQPGEAKSPPKGSPEQGTQAQGKPTSSEQPSGSNPAETKSGANAQSANTGEKPKDPAGSGNAQNKPTPEQMKELADAAKGLNSNDPKEKKAAQDKLDQMIGKENRQAAEKLANDLKSSDPKTRTDAEQKLKDMADQMKGQQGANAQNKPTPEQMKELADAAKGLNSNDPKEKKAAQDKLDQMIGKENRQAAEKLANDLKSTDPKTRADAEQKLKDMADKMNQGQQGANAQNKPTPEQMKELADAAKGLNSNDPKEKKAAQDKLDQMIGKENRQAAEKLANDLKSTDPKTRADAEQKLKDMADQMANQYDPKNDKGLSPEEAKKLAEKAGDLASPDDAKRKAAEKEFDEKIGKDNRQAMQDLMKDINSPDPQKREEARKKAEEMMKQARDLAGNRSEKWNPGGIGGGRPAGKPLDDDPNDRLKTQELRLADFKKNRNNKSLLEKLGYTPEEYERFLKGYEQYLESERKRIAVESKSPKAPAGPATMNVNRGGEKITPGGTTAGPQGTGPSYAPPGYQDAGKKFAEEANKKKK